MKKIVFIRMVRQQQPSISIKNSVQQVHERGRADKARPAGYACVKWKIKALKTKALKEKRRKLA